MLALSRRSRSPRRRACGARGPAAVLVDGAERRHARRHGAPSTIGPGTHAGMSLDVLVDVSGCSCLDLDGGANVAGARHARAVALLPERAARPHDRDRRRRRHAGRPGRRGSPSAAPASSGTRAAAATRWSPAPTRAGRSPRSGPGAVALRSASGGRSRVAASSPPISAAAPAEPARRVGRGRPRARALHGGGGDDVSSARRARRSSTAAPAATPPTSGRRRVAVDLGVGVAVTPGGTDRLSTSRT